MDATDAIIVGMAETLVPDVCRIIMEYLEVIHIDLGRLRWKDRIKALNIDYKRTLHPITIQGREYPCCYNVNTDWVLFNYRNLTDGIYCLNVLRALPSYKFSPTRLPENYLHAKLYMD